MFPSEYSVSDRDKTYTAIETDEFFTSTKNDVAYGKWATNMYNDFFIDLMQLCEVVSAHQGRALLRTTEKCRIAKDEPKVTMAEALITASKYFLHMLLTQSFSQSDDSFSLVSKMSIESNSVVNLDNWKMSSHSLMHNFLKYIATMEHNTGLLPHSGIQGKSSL